MEDENNDKKRQRNDGEDISQQSSSSSSVTKKRRSRFADLDEQNEEDNNNAIIVSNATAKALLISQQLSSKSSTTTVIIQEPKIGSSEIIINDKVLKAATEMQAQLAAQIASVSSILNSVNKGEKKATYMPLRLDSFGREVDELGNIIQHDLILPSKTLAANLGGIKKKAENPYLAHRDHSSINKAAADTIEEFVDDRLQGSHREAKAKKAFKFVEAGVYVAAADVMRLKEERKIIAGYASGRKAPEVYGDTKDKGEVGLDNDVVMPTVLLPTVLSVPPPADGGVVPGVEWWDELFLPKDLRDLRKASKASAATSDDYAKVHISYVKTYKYIQHPVPIKPITSTAGNHGTEGDVPMLMYLTKKERKRIRKTARAERETEKRDKMMLGLIPAPEPKFKLSNFMKVLGDQAVADPSKVEMKVQEQMHKRQLNHEMRNQASKRTPQEKREKKMKKLQEDSCKNLTAAVFLVKDFSNPKWRFKVDVNAQQLFLSGTVILCQEGFTNLVIVEGGMKGIRKFVRVMLERIPWTQGGGEAQADGAGDRRGGAEEEESEDEDDEEDEEDTAMDTDKDMHVASNNSSTSSCCQLIWRGLLAKRVFSGFKFQECRTVLAARKLLEARGIAHFLDAAITASNA